MAQAGLCDKKLLLVENRNHVWMDLSRLVDFECKKWPVVLLKAFFRAEVVGDVNMAQAGLCDKKPSQCI